jgi:hypothetical protein
VFSPSALAASDQVQAGPALPPPRGCLNAVATGYAAGVDQAPFSANPGRAAVSRRSLTR